MHMSVRFILILHSEKYTHTQNFSIITDSLAHPGELL